MQLIYITIYLRQEKCFESRTARRQRKGREFETAAILVDKHLNSDCNKGNGGTKAACTEKHRDPLVFINATTASADCST